jgi:molybdenum cofactor guanylyltransferase
MDSDLKSQITGLVLAGGLGRRMGGLDKGLQIYQGAALVSHVLQRLRPQVGAVLISANRHLDAYQMLAPDAKVLPDTLPGFAGPLAGSLTGLTNCSTPFLVTVPCDAPHLPLDLVSRLLSPLLLNPDLELSFASTLQEGKQRDEPVFAMLRVTLRDDLAYFLHKGGRAVRQWLAKQRGARVCFSDAFDFLNINF